MSHSSLVLIGVEHKYELCWRMSGKVLARQSALTLAHEGPSAVLDVS